MKQITLLLTIAMFCFFIYMFGYGLFKLGRVIWGLIYDKIKHKKA